MHKLSQVRITEEDIKIHLANGSGHTNNMRIKDIPELDGFVLYMHRFGTPYNIPRNTIHYYYYTST